MAQFCTKCGAPLGEGMQFCTSCGATVGAPSAPPARAAAPPAAPVAASPASAAPAPAAAPAAKGGSSVIKAVLIIVGALFLFCLLGVGSCVYYAYRVKQRVRQFEKEARVTFPTATGTREVHAQPVVPPAAPTPPAGPVVDTGVPVYPGATPFGGGTQVTGPTATMKTQQYTTSDSLDKVLAFYKDKLGPNAMVTQSGGKALVQTLGTGGGTTVTISPDSRTGNTLISITNIGK